MPARRIAILSAIALAGCSHVPGPEAPPNSLTLPRAGSASSPDQPPVAAPIAGGAFIGERRQCIDLELARRGLNEWGDPLGTIYPAGSPAYKLVARNALNRYAFVLQQHGDIGTVCSVLPEAEGR
jgi:hypothetical protein